MLVYDDGTLTVRAVHCEMNASDRKSLLRYHVQGSTVLLAWLHVLHKVTNKQTRTPKVQRGFLT